MPPVSQPGSRAGLITALVMFVLLTCVGGIFAVYYYLEWDKTRQENVKLVSQKNAVVNSEDEQGADFGKLQEIQQTTGGETLYSILLKQRNAAAQLVPVPPGTPEAMQAAAKKAHDAVQGKLPQGMTLAPDYVNALNALADDIIAKNNRIVELGEQIKSKDREIAAKIKETADQLKQRDAGVATAAEAAKQAEQKSAEYTQAKDKEVASIQESTTKEIATTKEEANQLQVQLQEKEKLIAQAEKEAKALRDRLAKFRVDTLSALARQPDGKITSVPTSGMVNIDLGQDDQISVGMTFEVYDKQEGMPKPGETVTDDQLPMGKGAVEVVNVGPRGSECKVLRVAPGRRLGVGDSIANLVYSKDTKFKFVVYAGDGFDLEQTGRPNPRDAENLSYLIQRWGGTVSNKLDTNTDFLLIGKEPELPSIKEDDTDPATIAAREAATERLNKYNAIRDLAAQYHVPVLNQNRFLYFVGYYDKAKQH